VRRVTPGPEAPWRDGEDAIDHALAQAAAKALGADVAGGHGLVLAADTVVVVEGRCLGKPRDRAEAARFLDLLAGRRHEVATAHAWVPVAAGRLRADRLATATTRAEVAVARLSPAERDAYVDTLDWQDKAGGYGIQGVFGAHAQLAAGELDTVVGLNLRTVRLAWSDYLASELGD
jgi:septum formation protein